MTFRTFLIIMACASLAAWIGWIVVLYSIDPVRSGTLGYVLFYLSLATALIGTVSVLGVLVRIWTKQEGLVVVLSLRSFRHAVLLTGVFVSSLMFLGVGLLRWWTVIGIVVIASIIELIFINSRGRTS